MFYFAYFVYVRNKNSLLHEADTEKEQWVALVCALKDGKCYKDATNIQTEKPV